MLVEPLALGVGSSSQRSTPVGCAYACRRHLGLRSEAELLIHQDRRDTAGSDRLVDNQEVVYSAANAVGLPRPLVLKRKAVLVDASQPGVEIGDNFLTTDDEEDVPRSGDDWTELAPAGRRDQK